MNLTDNNAIEGVLWQSRGPWLVLREAKFLAPHATPQAIDGEAVVHRSRVSFIQVLP